MSVWCRADILRVDNFNFSLILRKINSRLTINYIAGYRVFVDIFFICLKTFPTTLVCWSCFIMNRHKIWSYAFSIAILKFMRFTSYTWLIWWITFQIFSQMCIPRLNPTYSLVFVYCGIWLTNIFKGFLCLYSWGILVYNFIFFLMSLSSFCIRAVQVLKSDLGDVSSHINLLSLIFLQICSFHLSFWICWYKEVIPFKSL